MNKPSIGDRIITIIPGLNSIIPVPTPIPQLIPKTAAVGTIPEPSSILLALLALVGIFIRKFTI